MGQIFNRYLDTNGNGTGTDSAIGDYSSVEGIFYVQPSLNQVLTLHRLIVCIQDGQGFRAERYVSLGAALSNGVALRVSNDKGIVTDVTNGNPIVNNAGWGGLCYDVDLKTWGAGDEILLARYSFDKAGTQIALDGDNGDKFEVLLNDNFTGVVTHRFMVQGHYGYHKDVMG